jgi:dihydroxyacid dehydratase/phosphogluconate dehydratase
VVTDARFSGVSTGACIGHVSPEALAGGPIGKLVDGDVVEITIDRRLLEGRLELVAAEGQPLTREEAQALLDRRPLHSALAPHPRLPDDTRLWAALQRVSGGAWGGCVYDVDRIIEVLDAGLAALSPKPQT